MTEKDELCEQLWDKYFLPKTPLSNQERKDLMNQYNEVAKEINQLAGFKRVILLTPSTRWIPDKKEEKESKQVATKVTGGSIIQQIIALYKEGKSNKEIIAMGYNKSTVARQISEHKKQSNK